MHNWSIFQYHRVRARSNGDNVGAVSFGKRADRVSGG